MSKSETFNCDCFEYMKSLPDNFFDLCLCDSPYVDLEENTGSIRITGNKQASLALGGKPSDEVFQEIFRVSKHQIIWGANNFGYPFQGFVVWEKTNIPDDFTMSRCEIASLDKGLSRVSKMVRMPSSINSEKRIHQTQKPVGLYGWLLNRYAKEGWTIFDPFMGSQSSRIAAYELGFDFYGCEIDEHFYKEGCKRFENHIKQLKLF